MRINEIFYSLQGEGNFTGTPAVFIRFSGCNMRCSFCDTKHESFKEMTEEEIISTVNKYPASHVVITGGEPGLQLNKTLIKLLHESKHFVQIETNGTLPVPTGVDWVTCSPKEGPWEIERTDELKYVYRGKDVEWLRDIFHTHRLFLQPLSCTNTDETIAYIKAHPHWRLSLQTHKLINIP